MINLALVNSWTEPEARQTFSPLLRGQELGGTDGRGPIALRCRARGTAGCGLEIWRAMPSDWLEAFAAHPKMAPTLNALKNKFAGTRLVGRRASGRRWRFEAVFTALAEAKSSVRGQVRLHFHCLRERQKRDDMLGILEEAAAKRSGERNPHRRRRTRKDHALTLAKIDAMSPITTHILDTSRGRPAAGVAVVLGAAIRTGVVERVGLQDSSDPDLLTAMQVGPKSWNELALGTTNEDGRIADLLPKGILLTTGIYRISLRHGKRVSRPSECKAFIPRCR